MGAFAIPIALAGLAFGASRLTNNNSSASRTARTTTPGQRQRTTQAATRLGRDARQPTVNAVPTGSHAVPRGTATPRPTAAATTTGTPKPPDVPSARATAASEASRAAAKMKRKGQTQRPGTMLTGPVTAASLTPRTLLGIA